MAPAAAPSIAAPVSAPTRPAPPLERSSAFAAGDWFAFGCGAWSIRTGSSVYSADSLFESLGMDADADADGDADVVDVVDVVDLVDALRFGLRRRFASACKCDNPTDDRCATSSARAARNAAASRFDSIVRADAVVNSSSLATSFDACDVRCDGLSHVVSLVCSLK